MANPESGAQAPQRETSGDAAGRQDDGSRGLDAMLVALDEALARAPATCFAALKTGPLSRAMATALAHLEPHESLRVLHRMAVSPHPETRRLPDVLMTPALNGFGQVLYSDTCAQHRQALLASIFNPVRVQALAKACRVLAKETT